MLKIKDNVDLRELVDKYDFKYTQYFYCSWEYEKWGIRVESSTRKIGLLPNADIDLLYDLIKVGFVEKVNDNNGK
jgi:hypothetical protein